MDAKVNKMSRLFLPLTSEAFGWYNLSKDVEVRKLKGRFKSKLIHKYKFAELRKGYSGASKYATITRMIIYNSSQELFDDVTYNRVIPVAKSRKDAERLVSDYIGTESVIAIFLSF